LEKLRRGLQIKYRNAFLDGERVAVSEPMKC
jgi:hypothetical protein